ncbi:MAG: DNA repair protein RecN [Acidimicrobiales bacterium]
MLTELRVRDLGVIADLTLLLGPGMTVLTGETGAGKTLVVEALQLVAGGRASAHLVRAEAGEMVVEARFELDEADPDGEAERLLARAVAATGRSRAWVDGRMAPVSALAEVGGPLVDIHGQHEHQALAGTAAQRRALDAFARTDLGPLAAARRSLAGIEGELDALGGDDHRRARETDVLRHQIAEIDAATIIDPDEDAHLAGEEARLADLSALREAAWLALAAVEGSDAAGLPPSALGTLGEAVGALSGHAPLAEWEGRLRSVLADAVEAASDLRRAVEGWEDDPDRLAEVQARRRLLADLRRKYGTTLADVRAFAEESRRALADLERRAARATDLQARRDEARRDVERAEEDVHQARARAAPQLAAAVGERLGSLAMPDARLEVDVPDGGAGDGVQFLLAANPGEPPQSLAKVASGGELARTMLALRLVTGGGAPTALFDEVDAGVGGAAALALAEALHQAAAARQVLVVTHLPQVAAVADHHYAVHKVVGEDGRTVTTVEALDGDARVVEVSRMLSGHPDSPTARAHAEELLGHRPAGRRRSAELEHSTTGGAPSE